LDRFNLVLQKIYHFRKPHDNSYKLENYKNDVPVYLDVHKVPFSEGNLKELCQSPKDEFGVEHINLFYNPESRVCFCLLKAPNKEMVEEHHNKVDIKCEWIMEVKMASPSNVAKPD